ncbi:hypothetical protein ACMHYJ_02480 [Castellaniella hirudinis]|uniref:hypothetical protein n=1 Tax=Castellaniella hirudinis TaxID=1144617 RepID=UPI0039C3F86E
MEAQRGSGTAVVTACPGDRHKEETHPMDTFSALLVGLLAGWALRMHDQRTRITLLGRHLANLQIERHMETLTQGYTRAIHEATEARQLQVLARFAQAEQAVAAQAQRLADALQKEDAQATRISLLPVHIPYATRFLPIPTRDFRQVLQIHAAGLRRAADNVAGWDAKTRAYHLSAELYLLQHSCHWFCKSRAVANARLMLRHQVDYQKVLDSVSDATRAAYRQWLQGAGQAAH